jgi:hypothetical protein
MTQNTKIWLHGLGGAFVGAVGSSISNLVVAPDRFNMTSLAGVKNVLASATVSGVIAAGLYLKNSPVPSLTVQQESKSEEISDASGTVKTETKTTTIQQ